MLEDYKLRIECIPYKNFREKIRIRKNIEQARKNKKLTYVRDLGGCFYLEYNSVNINIRC